MKLEGGFLKDQVVHFNRNLTCIIGGRGAGKSTMLESLRVASGNPVDNSLVDSEVWPDSITLIYKDQTGQLHTLVRRKLSEVANISDDANGPTRVDIESYGQGETAETIQHCDRDPSILLRFLDEFIDLAELRQRDEEIRESLLNNQTEIERLHLSVSRIPEIEKAKAIADKQLEALRQQNAGTLVELEHRLVTEQRFRTQLNTTLAELLGSVADCLSSESLNDLITTLDGSSLVVGKAEFAEVQKLVAELCGRIDGLVEDLKQQVGEFAKKIQDQLKAWTAKECQTRERIEDIRRELEKQKIKLDMAFIRKVTKDASDHTAKLQELRKLQPALQQAWKRRRDLLQQRRQNKSRMFTIRQAFATVMNKNLASTVVDYRVTIRFREGLLSTECEGYIKAAMDWRTSQVPKATLMAAQLSPITLLDAIEKKNTKPIEDVVDVNGNKVFSAREAGTVLAALGEWKNRTLIERCAFDDRPEIRVTKPVTRPDGTMVYPVRDFSQLSLGQQQSILLSIMLFSKSTVPLIIDQPEDNLDGEFIYKTLVRSLRSVKEQRQVIIVTHNANIAVLGDAELIVPLRASSEYAVVRDRGSIDNPATKDLVCTILEGSRRAFRRRLEVYGF